MLQLLGSLTLQASASRPCVDRYHEAVKHACMTNDRVR